MRRPTPRAIPLSYAKTFQPSRAGEASALTTGLGSVSFVGFDIHRLPSGSLVPQHISEHRPARIQNGFCHSGFGEAGGVHIADDDQTICVSQALAGDVEVMLSSAGDLGVDRSNAFLVAGALGIGELRFILAVMPERWYFRPVANRGERLEAQINPYLSIASLETVFDLALQGDIPAAASILHKRTRLECALNFPVLPKSETTLEVNGGCVAIDSDCAWNEWYPSESALGPETGAEAGTLAMLVARCGKLAADGLHSITMQTEFRGASSTKLD